MGCEQTSILDLFLAKVEPQVGRMVDLGRNCGKANEMKRVKRGKDGVRPLFLFSILKTSKYAV